MTTTNDNLTHSHIMEAVAEMRGGIRDLATAIKTVDTRLVRVETVLALIGAIVITGTAMASCALANRVVTVPTVHASP